MADELTAEELSLLENLLSKIDSFREKNLDKLAYYQARHKVAQLGIAIPPKVLTKIETVTGWAGTVVDVLEERLDLLGWADSTDDYGLEDVFAANNLDVESGHGHLDALIFGTAFIAVGTGDPSIGEPKRLITVESPMHMTGNWDARTRRLSAAASRTMDPESKQILSATLYLPDQTIRVVRASEGQIWEVLNRDVHNLGRVPVVQLVNRPHASNLLGRSEITRAVRSYTDMAVRTLLGMEVNREFYSAPQRWAMQVSPDQFVKADGTTVTGWEAIMGRMLAIPFDEDNPEANPTVGQFPQSQPGPYLEQLRGLASLMAAESAIPVSYFGFQTDNPPSADAIRAMESRLIKRAERRQAAFGKAWMEAARLVALMDTGSVPDDFNTTVSVDWLDAATPTRSAQADDATKLVGAGILPPDSMVTYRRLGLSKTEIKQLEADKRKARLNDLIAKAQTPQPQPDPNQSQANQPADQAANIHAASTAGG